MNFVLVGLSGTGKSSVGRALAARLGCEFVDTDVEVVRMAGRPIHQVFAEEGEAAFRRLESEAVQMACAGQNRVISLGGGAAMDASNRQMLDGSVVVMLEASVETMLERLRGGDTEPRPMLASPDPRARMESLKEVRDPVYRGLAQVVVSTDGVDVDGAAERVAAVVAELVAAGFTPARGPVAQRPLAPPGRAPVNGAATGIARLSIRAAAGQYQVLLGRGLLDSAGRLLLEAGLKGRVRLIADATVYGTHGPRLEAALRRDGYQVVCYQVAPGEGSKSLDTAARLYDWLVETGTERRDLVLALGGGVVGDLAGFVAATFLRGLRLVQLPTSLLAQVDSSVGGKVAVNHPSGKNLVGAFYPPSLVIADTATLSTLPRRELSGALAEVVKHGVILDEALFGEIERQAGSLLDLEAGVLDPIIARSIQLKAQVVEQDEREAGIRAILNYGHTIGHAVEAVTEFAKFRHGEGVAIGMVGAAQLAIELDMIDDRTAARQRELLARLELPVACPGLAVDKLLAAMGHDKKASEGKLTWVLPEGIGRVVVRRDVPVEMVERVLRAIASGKEDE